MCQLKSILVPKGTYGITKHAIDAAPDYEFPDNQLLRKLAPPCCCFYSSPYHLSLVRWQSRVFCPGLCCFMSNSAKIFAETRLQAWFHFGATTVRAMPEWCRWKRAASVWGTEARSKRPRSERSKTWFSWPITQWISKAWAAAANLNSTPRLFIPPARLELALSP